jgi:HPt (histidine-containing phosphotransfer) domain-containing protein
MHEACEVRVTVVELNSATGVSFLRATSRASRRGEVSMSARHVHSRPPGGSPFAVEVLDIGALRERAGGDEPFVVELLEDFLCRGVSMQDVHAAAGARDLAALGRLAHRLKGSLLSLGAISAASAAGEVEVRAATLAIAADPHDTRGFGALSVAIDVLGERFDAACDAMRCVMDDATSVTSLVSPR